MALVLLGLLGLFGVVLARLVKLHVIEPGAEGYQPPRKYVRSDTLLGLRGRILDRNGAVLAESVSGRDIYIDRREPNYLKLDDGQKAALYQTLAKLLNVPQEKLAATFADPARRRSIRLCTITDDATIRELERRGALRPTAAERIFGVDYHSVVSIRSRPNGARLGHTLGYINGDGQGLYGIEQQFNSYLEGSTGAVVRMVDSRRREIRDRRIDEVPAQHGDDVVLTIDNNIQYLVETALANALETFQAESGIILVQRVKTGEILGMATLPGIDPQHFGDYPKSQWNNPAVSYTYEPGSVMKVVTVALALQYGVITEQTAFDVGQRGVWEYGGKLLHDHAYGVLHAKEILAQSSNIGTAMIGLKLAEPHPELGTPKSGELLCRGFYAMGFRQPTGIDLEGEQRGILHDYRSKHWNKLSPTRIPIGQSIAVTPVQLCNAYATIANGGKRMRPMLVKEIRDHEGEVKETREPEILGRPLSQKTCDAMLRMMQAVTDRSQGGTAAKAALPSYTVAGKTGTGQIPVNGKYNHSDYNASFVGIYPATAPELVILVTITKPKGAYRMGGSVAAPTFAAVAEEIGHYLGIPADKEVKETR